MFDFRYHVASLAAVFIALVTGIVVGVAISGSGFVESRERDLLDAEIRDLRNDLDRARTRERELLDAQSAAQAFVEESYPAVIANRLRDRRIAVLFVGQIDTAGVLDAVDRTISDAGGERVRLLAVEVPIDGRLEA
nr:copper transporter [Actinomycetota bacterium]